MPTPEFIVGLVERNYWLSGAEVLGPGTYGVVLIRFHSQGGGFSAGVKSTLPSLLVAKL